MYEYEVKKERIDWIDVAKGFAIILVIIGHIIKVNMAYQIIYAFHMPLFFIISGYFFKQTKTITSIKKHAKRLLVPFLFFWIVAMIITIAIPAWRPQNISTFFKAILYTGYTGDVGFFHISSIWFLISLFVITILFNFISLIKQTYIKATTIISLLIIGFILAAFTQYPNLIIHGHSIPLPWQLNVSLIALSLFAIGKYVIPLTNKWYVLLISAIVFPLSVYFNGVVNMHLLTFGNPILFILEAISGSILFMEICKLITKLLNKTHFLTFIKWFGRNSLIIMGTQILASELYVLIIGKIVKEDLKRNNLPWQHELGCFIFSFVICILVCLICDLVKNKWIKRSSYEKTNR